MNSVTPIRILAAGAATLAFPGLAFAHSGHGAVQGWVAGLAHPMLGLDHMLAALAVGVWAAQNGGRARWTLPATFVAVMACGTALGVRGLAPSAIDLMILMSVMGLGALIATTVRLPMAASMGGVALLAFFHGLAHGAEVPATAGALSYGGGLVVATATLCAAGFMAGRAAHCASTYAIRALGATIAVGGLGLLIR